MTARCDRCRFFEHYADEGTGNKGACRRRAPAPSEYEHQSARWPIVHQFDWCGEGEGK